MNWLRKILNWFWRRDQKVVPTQGDDSPVAGTSAQLPAYIHQARDLFREATECYQAGDFKTAIALLDQSQKLYTDHNDLVPEEVLLQRPDYLKALGQDQQAWEEYHRIIARYTAYNNQVDIMILARVYDKMRLFQHQAKNYDLAIVYAALSYLAWNMGLALQKRFSELEGWQDWIQIEHGLGRTYQLVNKQRKEQIIRLISDVDPQLEHLNLAVFEQQCLQLPGVQ